ncbi:MAG: hypothetical protein JNL90_06275 [Planctomycetes bacterium]|nr:hypothetical protein [Planctomycetota bacterium]
MVAPLPSLLKSLLPSLLLASLLLPAAPCAPCPPCAPAQDAPHEAPRLRYTARSEPSAALTVVNQRLLARHFGRGRAPRLALALRRDAAAPLDAGVVEIDFAGSAPLVAEEHQLRLQDGVVTAACDEGERRLLGDVVALRADPLLLLRWRANGGPFSLRLAWRAAAGDAASERASDANRATLLLRGAGVDGALRATCVGGRLEARDGALEVRDAYALVVLVTLAAAPATDAGDPLAALAACQATLAAATARPLDELLARHEAAEAERFGDFTLELGDLADVAERRLATTDARLRRFAQGADDPDLVATWFLATRRALLDQRPEAEQRATAARWLATPSAWCAALPSTDRFERFAAERGRRDGDAAWAALAPLLARESGDDLRPLAPDGGAAAIAATTALATLLLDERDGALALLPALPRTWGDGLLRSWRTPSGAVVDLRWSDGALDAARLTAESARALRLRLPEGDFEVVALAADGTPSAPLAVQRPAPRELVVDAPAATPLLLQRRR